MNIRRGFRGLPQGAALDARATIHAMRTQRGRVLAVTAIGFGAIATAALGPITSGVLPGGDTPATVAVFVAVGFFWLAALVVSLVRQPAKPLWLLMLAYLTVSRLVWGLQFFPNELVAMVASSVVYAQVALYAHVLIAYPSGTLSTRFDRALVFSVYVIVIMTGASSFGSPGRSPTT